MIAAAAVVLAVILAAAAAVVATWQRRQQYSGRDNSSKRGRSAMAEPLELRGGGGSDNSNEGDGTDSDVSRADSMDVSESEDYADIEAEYSADQATRDQERAEEDEGRVEAYHKNLNDTFGSWHVGVGMTEVLLAPTN